MKHIDREKPAGCSRPMSWMMTLALAGCVQSIALPGAEGAALASLETTVEPKETGWVRAGINTNAMRWGIHGSLLWGLPPPSGRASDGPRGLIRLYYPVFTNGAYDLINFIAIEPVVSGQKGYSELESSQLDSQVGKRLWVAGSSDSKDEPARQRAGELTRLADGVEILAVSVRVEPFLNGAHVALTIEQRSDVPDEIQLTIQAEPDSAPLEYCILTATMGNKARTRHLWLRDQCVSSLNLYPGYREAQFTPHQIFPLERFHRTPTGDLLVAITTDEANPSVVPPPARTAHWFYGGAPVTQYWRKPPGAWRSDLHVAVNGRYTYWMSNDPIPGGIAFENFELRERFHQHQRFNFGITRRSPAELGFNITGTAPVP